MCIRAIDYCPPVDITFGDFLRGIITADLDYAPEDKSGFRIVFIESFREWGIYPRGLTSMGLDTLAWPRGDELLQDLVVQRPELHSEADLRRQLKDFVVRAMQNWNLESNRHEVWKDLSRVRKELWSWLRDSDSMGRYYAQLFGLVIDDAAAPPTVFRNEGGPTVEIHKVRPAIRRTLNGSTRTALVVEITQRRRGYFDREVQKKLDGGTAVLPEDAPPHDFVFRAGCTILIDPVTAEVRRVIRTPGTIADDTELERVRRFLTGEAGGVGNAFDAGLAGSMDGGCRITRDEPFALMHQLEEE
jgi:hypothetical protein